MKYLLPGHESMKRVELLLKLTRIRSDSKVAALKVHLVEGLPASRARARFGITQQGWQKVINQLNKTAALVEQINELKE